MNSENSAEMIWELVKDSLRSSYSDTLYSLWFGDLTVVGIDADSAVLSSKDKFKYDILRKKYIPTLEEKFEEVMGFPIKVEITLDGEAKPKFQSAAVTLGLEDDGEYKAEESNAAEKFFSGMTKTKEPEKPVEINLDGAGADFLNRKDYTFENFIVGNSNKFAHAACTAVAETPGSVYNPLFIYGPSGLGKTHLMSAVTNEIAKKKPGTNVIYIKCEDFTNQLVDSIYNSKMAAFREKFRRADVLLIDDIQFVAGKESTQEEIFHTFNALYEDHKQIILTCDRPAKDIKPLEDRLKTRFEWGLIADIQPPDLELRSAIIKKKAEMLGITLTNDVVSYLAEKLKSNIRQIEGSLKRLSATSFVSGEKVTLDMAMRCLSDIVSEELPLSMKIRRILDTVGEKYGVEADDIKGKKRTKDIAWARHVAIYIMRTKTDMSLPAIGAELSGRDHATVLSSYKTVEKEMSQNPSFAVEINELMNEIDI